MLPLVDSVQTWSPARGRTYIAPIDKDKDKASSKHGPGSTATGDKPSSVPLSTPDSTEIPESMILDSFFLHEQYGGEYMDENPITGKPGEFVLLSTGRKEKLPAKPATTPALPALNIKAATQENPLAAGGKTVTGKETKSPKTAGMPKPKRRKSKMAVTPS